jgi:hypothetical protein
MRFIEWMPKRQIASILVLLLIAPFALAASPQGQETSFPGAEKGSSAQRRQAGASVTASEAQNAGTLQAEAALPDAPTPAQSQSTSPVEQRDNAQSTQGQNAQPGQSQQPNTTPAPIGTAAAPSASAEGIAASRPAGAVIAPSKQRRVRTILISVGVVVGAGVALGTVAALSHGSPSQPR